MNVVSPGDELLGLVRGLLYAGARSLMLSLWDVQDKSTAEFMTAFYQALNDGQSKRAALRTATLQMKSQYPHCYQWAAFILVGQA
jgi:CHAT domain-containing protein